MRRRLAVADAGAEVLPVPLAFDAAVAGRLTWAELFPRIALSREPDDEEAGGLLIGTDDEDDDGATEAVPLLSPGCPDAGTCALAVFPLPAGPVCLFAVAARAVEADEAVGMKQDGRGRQGLLRNSLCRVFICFEVMCLCTILNVRVCVCVQCMLLSNRPPFRCLPDQRVDLLPPAIHSPVWRSVTTARGQLTCVGQQPTHTPFRFLEKSFVSTQDSKQRTHRQADGFDER